MFDGKILVGTTLTASMAASTWVDVANSYGQLALTAFGLLVAVFTAWYTWERATALRKKRKEGE